MNKQIKFKTFTYEPILKKHKSTQYIVNVESIANAKENQHLITEKKGKAYINVGTETQLLIPDEDFPALVVKLLTANFDAVALYFKKYLIPIIKKADPLPLSRNPKIAVNIIFNFLLEKNLIYDPNTNLYYDMVYNLLMDHCSLYEDFKDNEMKQYDEELLAREELEGVQEQEPIFSDIDYEDYY
jgi:hypothetical protein